MNPPHPAPLVSVIVPCYNECEVIELTHARITESLKGDWNKGYEIIYINDGSFDSTLELLRIISRADAHAKVISFSRNFGHQAAISAGLKESKGDVAIIIDADLQDPPELIQEMVRVYRYKYANVVNTVRQLREGETWFKLFTARLFYSSLNRLSEVKLNNVSGDFRLIDRRVIDAFNNLNERNKYIRGLIGWMGYRQEFVEYVRQARAKGETKYTFKKMLRLASVAMFYFSKKPLKMATTLGFVSIVVGLLLTLWVVFQYFFEPEKLVKGWASTFILIIFFGGVQLLTIGVLGEYIGNILDEVKKRPEYLVDEKINL